MDAGERWTLNNVAGNPIRSWNSRSFQSRIIYDELRRSTHAYVRLDNGAEVLVEHSVYGESHPEPESLNLRGQVYQLYDQAGVVTNPAYDFKGNALEGQRQLALNYKQQ